VNHNLNKAVLWSNFFYEEMTVYEDSHGRICAEYEDIHENIKRPFTPNQNAFMLFNPCET
jgi:hypothetical protein